MRFRSAFAILGLGAALGCAAAPPEAVRDSLAARLAAQLPGVRPADYARGAAAFDPEIAAQDAAHAGDALPVVREGERLWKRRFRDGRSLAACFPNGGRRIASAYPQYHPRLKRVVTLEMAVNQCLKMHGEPLLDPGEAQTMGAITAYLRSLSAGRRLAVRVPPGAREAFEEGRRLYFTRMGQWNFACASCHVQGAGKRYGELPLAPAIGQAARWPFIRGASASTLQMEIRACLERMGAAPFATGSPELNRLEYFLTYLSNGLAIRPNAWRPAAPASR